jgi:uncharacterized protein YutE (UPF0331/DUF86 family)
VVDRQVVHARLAKIREYVALLRRIRGMADERAFIADPLVYGNAERYLQLAIGLPASSGELFATLARHKVLSVRLSRKLALMA